MWKLWALLLAICTACAFLSSGSTREPFAINDYYDKYLNDIAVPASFYSQTRYASGFKKIEMNDRFFTDVLKKASVGTEPAGDPDPDAKQPGNLLERANALLASVLNASLPSGDSSIFAVVRANTISASAHPNNQWVLDSEHIVYRDGKAYGAAVSARTLHTPEKTDLVDAKLLGFVLEDRIGAYEPYNLQADNKNQAFMHDKTFLRDKKYEHEYVCRYLSDLEKFRGIKTPGAPDCSDVV